MKKLFSLMLACLLLVSLFSGCTQNAPSETTVPATEGLDPDTLSLGFGRVDITPTEPMPMGSSINGEYLSGDVVERLYATCMAFTDGADNKLLLYHLDLKAASAPVIAGRSKISKKTGVPGLQIIIASTHNHNAPNLTKEHPSVERYNEALPDKLLEAAELAIADQKPVTGMYTATARPLGLNFVRHHILEDGSKTGWASPAVQSGVAHTADADNEMQLIKFTREGGKDIIFMNWQGHPDATRVGKEEIRSDVDIVRKEMESQLNCYFAYFLGASGNVNTYSYIKGENITANYVERGKALAKYAIDAAPSFQEVKIGKIKFLYEDFKQPSMANETVQRSIPLYAFSIGDVAFTTASYEMFTEMGMHIKKESPFPMTFVSTCTNGSNGYLPIDSAFDYDAYETSITKYVRGTAEKTAEEHINMLKQIFEAK